MLFPLITLAIAFTTTVVSGKPVLRPRHARNDGIYTSCNRPGVFAMTFDDGPYEHSWELATYLNEMGIRSTFFINGNNWINVEKDSVSTPDGEKSYMDVIRHYSNMGHEVASHTYEHKELQGLSKEDIEYQMNVVSDIIYDAIGKRPAIMRPPTGSYDAKALQVLKDLGYSVVNWDLDTNDWRSHDLDEEKMAYKEIDDESDSTNGHITLEHEVYEQTVYELVPWAIEYVRSRDLEFVTVSDCLGVDAYQ
ncbi:hypothetical protein BY458DRAFT_494047 [Sporodiniella umbellata]|nr:hypothetical protein BY458DRAFT_494047 [Sporodiniella umbellata]